MASLQKPGSGSHHFREKMYSLPLAAPNMTLNWNPDEKKSKFQVLLHFELLKFLQVQTFQIWLSPKFGLIQFSKISTLVKYFEF